ncbi:hypothetical protein [Levilactobacillus enshiensis]|uniref:hypothetical protein n=1 Tax=Levilactobacillus enshiensis TaxID=2590213 RepID=UPI00117B417D|nr:hypothetical protein [Levilactobacillus enshiensis]
MKKIVKNLLLIGVAIGGVGVLTTSQPAQAKSYAKVTKYGYNYKESATYFSFTGNYALYTKPGTIKGAKLVKSKKQLLALNASKTGEKTFMWRRKATTNRGAVYYKVETFDHSIKGWIYAGKTKQHSLGMIYYKKTAAKPAGGVQFFSSLTDSALTTEETTHFYRLTTPGTVDDGTQLLYTLPFWAGFDGKTQPNKKSTVANKNDVFVIDNAKTRVREGDRWVVAYDVNRPGIGGYIKESGLTAIPTPKASEGVTINYRDTKTDKLISSFVLPVLGGAKTTDVVDINNFQIPAGYVSDTESMTSKIKLGFANQSTKNVKVGSQLNYYVIN